MIARPGAAHRRRRFTVAKYQQTGRAGVLDDAVSPTGFPDLEVRLAELLH